VFGKKGKQRTALRAEVCDCVGQVVRRIQQGEEEANEEKH